MPHLRGSNPQLQNCPEPYSLEGGILAKLSVDEGQRAAAGELLVEIKDVKAKADLAVNAAERYALRARLNRMQAFQKGESTIVFDQSLNGMDDLKQHETQLLQQELATVNSIKRRYAALIAQREQEARQARSQLAILERGLALKQQELAMNRPLVKTEAISKVAFLSIQEAVNKLEQEVSQAKINVPRAKSALEEAKEQQSNALAEYSERVLKERSEVEAKLGASSERSSALQDRVARTAIRSPIDGVVKNIEITTEGGVIRPGMPIMEIVPTDDELLIEARVKPKDVGFIQVGSPVKVKVTAFDFSRFGGLGGIVQLVSADTITDRKGNSFYKVTIRTDTNQLSDRYGESHQILPGMNTEADIVVSRASVARYILKPLMK